MLGCGEGDAVLAAKKAQSPEKVILILFNAFVEVIDGGIVAAICARQTAFNSSNCLQLVKLSSARQTVFSSSNCFQLVKLLSWHLYRLHGAHSQ
ncbi:uncharacterized protein TrAtP1_002295 [Trichoderma atroviride]|uniref:uncharacterized protein n=1 Tax=Hypocrea atroviridis TaxID=63577 RepID=UPI00332F468C|nr:hypothetical protein TrAtP1_002295 [Trichoderma atroviride]